MINYNKIFTYTAACMAIILPIPGRIAYGLYAIISFNIVLIVTTLLLHVINHLKLEPVRIGIIGMELIAITVLLKQLLIIFCPIAALTIGYSLYLPAVSSVVLTLIVSHQNRSLKEDCIAKLWAGLSISGICMLLFVMRDIFGFGTITLPAWKKLYIIKLPVFFENISLSAFLATIPGCLFLFAVILFIYSKITENKNA